MRSAVYTGTRNLYGDMVTAAKSLLIHSNVEKIYFLIEDDVFPYDIPTEIETINVSNQQYFKPDSPNMTSQYSYMALMRAALAKVFPDLDTILSLDVDTIVVKDISDIWDIDLSDSYFAACHETHRTKNGYVYTNAGVTLFNLKKLRDDGKADKMIKLLNTQVYRWVDQDVMNLVCQGHIKELASDYNVNRFTKPTNNMKIVHYAGDSDWRDEQLVQRYRKISFDEISEN